MKIWKLLLASCLISVSGTVVAGDCMIEEIPGHPATVVHSCAKAEKKQVLASFSQNSPENLNEVSEPIETFCAKGGPRMKPHQHINRLYS